VLTDKLPHNFLFLALIARLHPGARIVHCVRDPLDVAASCFGQHFHPGNPAAVPLSELGHIIQDHDRLMAHWHRVLPLPILTLRYEDTVADIQGTARRLVDFAGLPWSPACAVPHLAERQVITSSYAQVREPVHGRSVGRAARYGELLDPVRDALGLDRALAS
jgi:hypothetical protein